MISKIKYFKSKLYGNLVLYILCIFWKKFLDIYHPNGFVLSGDFVMGSYYLIILYKIWSGLLLRKKWVRLIRDITLDIWLMMLTCSIIVYSLGSLKSHPKSILELSNIKEKCYIIFILDKVASHFISDYLILRMTL